MERSEDPDRRGAAGIKLAGQFVVIKWREEEEEGKEGRKQTVQFEKSCWAKPIVVVVVPDLFPEFLIGCFMGIFIYPEVGREGED